MARNRYLTYSIHFCKWLLLFQWWPSQAVKRSRLIPENIMKSRTNIILRRTGWRPSTCFQELWVMDKLAPTLNIAYMVCKITNCLVVYEKQEQPTKVKSYSLKNGHVQMVWENWTLVNHSIFMLEIPQWMLYKGHII